MAECPNCGEIAEDIEYYCPRCGEMDYGEGFYICQNCETLFDDWGEEWTCPNCAVSKGRQDYDTCPICGGIIEDDGYCSDCGENEDVNQGWIGENY